jgi:hypothetical protein
MTGFSGLQRLIYASRWKDPTRLDIDLMVSDILDKSVHNNRLAGVSGLLLFHRGWFLQVLEGPLEVVDDTFDRIRRDLRHTDIRTVADLPIAARAFGDWNMAAERLEGTTAAVLSELGLDPGFDPASLDPSSAMSLLLSARASHIEAADRPHLAGRVA